MIFLKVTKKPEKKTRVIDMKRQSLKNINTPINYKNTAAAAAALPAVTFK